MRHPKAKVDEWLPLVTPRDREPEAVPSGNLPRGVQRVPAEIPGRVHFSLQPTMVGTGTPIPSAGSRSLPSPAARQQKRAMLFRFHQGVIKVIGMFPKNA